MHTQDVPANVLSSAALVQLLMNAGDVVDGYAHPAMEKELKQWCSSHKTVRDFLVVMVPWQPLKMLMQHGISCDEFAQHNCIATIVSVLSMAMLCLVFLGLPIKTVVNHTTSY